MTYQSGDIILDKYRVDTLLGDGPCGEVYRVIRTSDKTQRAIKVFSQGTIGTGNLGFFNCRQRFGFEFQLAARLNSPEPNPYLLQIYDFIDTTECMILEMEYAPGGSLRGKILAYTQKGIAYPREKALRVACDVAIGLGTLHRAGIVHHNLKASNILFNLKDRIVFSDLGMAQGIGRTSSSSILSYSIPPSDIDGSFNLDRRLASDFANPTSDIYSLGHILFEMITGKDFNKLPPHSRLRDFIPGINPSLDDLLYSMMHESAGLRDLDASTVARKLQHELEIEEKAQREILSRKYDELAEWERLKNAELTRQKTGLADQQTKPVSDTKENNKPATEQEKIAPPEEEIELPDTTNDIASNKIDKKSKITKVSEVIEGSSKEQKQRFISKKIVLLSILLTAIVTVGIFYWNYLISIPEKKHPTSLPLKTIISPVPALDVTTSPKPTGSEVQLPVETAITPTQAFPSPSIVPPGGENGTSAIQNSKASSEIYSALNPGFEDTSAWTLRIGDSHILGKYTTEWASEGTGSYKIYMLGDANYEYCFLSGIRTTINQAVDLTDVDEVLFDLYLKPAVVMKDSQGNPVITKAVAFIDGEQLYKSVDNTEGFLPNQKLVLNKRFSGKHDLKIGLMTTYNFCVKGRNEADSLTLYIDNVRLITYQ